MGKRISPTILLYNQVLKNNRTAAKVMIIIMVMMVMVMMVMIIDMLRYGDDGDGDGGDDNRYAEIW